MNTLPEITEASIPDLSKPRPRLTARGRVFALVQLAVLGRMAGLTGQPRHYPIPRRRGKFKARLHRPC